MVLQRWQSVFLLIAAIVMGFYTFSTIATLTVAGVASEVSMLGGSMMWGFMVVSVLCALLAVVTIFKYRTLKLQRRLCLIGAGVTAALLASLLIVVCNIECDTMSLGWSNVLPLVAIVANVLAYRGITHDMKILSSYDRIR